ncbi:hypothetical protein HUJ05_007805 [Dendroctonus ponderosae]|nr:hypothetical protein HUJ05_007805 [Dendroctonus ponderosae]
MRSKHEIPNKTDYMKAYTFNLIETERTNCELENERNVGKIDGAFYRNFSWQIMGKQRERHLSQTDAICRRILRTDADVLLRLNTTIDILSTVRRRKGDYFGHVIRDEKFGSLQLIIQEKIEGRRAPRRRRTSWLKKESDMEIAGDFVQPTKKNAMLDIQFETLTKVIFFSDDLVEAKRHEALSGSTPLSNETQHEKSRCQEAKNDVLIESRTDFMGTAPKKYVSTCYFKPRTVPAWYTECILIHIGSTKRIYDEKIWFKQKLQPYYWTEKMTTTVNFPPTKAHFSDLTIPVRAEDVHFMSLEAQQIAV